MEVALLEFAELCEFNIWTIKEDIPELAIIPFDTDNKLMLTVNKKTQAHVNVKGAPESIFRICEFELKIKVLRT